METIKIFLVDNNRNFLLTAIKFLNTDPSIEVIGFATSGEEGVERIKEANPDIVLMDLSMPGIGGLKAISIIKSLENSPHVIVLTLHDTIEYKAEARFSGADGFVSKSEFGTELLPLIKSLFIDPIQVYPTTI